MYDNILKEHIIDTPLGSMLAISDERFLYLLEFMEKEDLKGEVEQLRGELKATVLPGVAGPVSSITKELELYFKGKLKEFKTPVKLLGSSFQKRAWEALVHIPYGTTRSYAEQAQHIGKPSAYRAVGSANGANKIAIVVPCHRVVNANGALGGYSSGIAKKKWLLDHERVSRG